MRPAILWAATLLLPGVATAENTDWTSRSHLGRSWGGVRTQLEERGISPYARYTTGFWSNTRGGFDTGTRYEGFAQWGIDADLESTLGLRGAEFHIGWHAYHGGQPSTDLIGQFSSTAVSGWEAETSVRFYQIHLRQELFAGRLVLKAGQLAADEDFFVSRYSGTLLNATFGSFALERADQNVPSYPLAAPGAYVAVLPTGDWLLHAGAYTADPGDDERHNIGFDWTLDEGATFFAEVILMKRPFGRAGRYAFGAAGTTARLLRQKAAALGETVSGGYAIWVLIDQALGPEASTLEDLGVFARAQFSPQEDRFAQHFYVDVGLEYTAPFPGRERDVASLAVAYLDFGDDYVSGARSLGFDVSEYQVLLELTYRAQVTGWLSLQPDVQLFFEPNFSRRDALVIGLRAVIEL